MTDKGSVLFVASLWGSGRDGETIDGGGVDRTKIYAPYHYEVPSKAPKELKGTYALWFYCLSHFYWRSVILLKQEENIWSIENFALKRHTRQQ